ncbi:hypothetical protein [Winogradskyella sp.]|uniref:hypothetical protein n=1 Tax=Winogradskyella sp. TaxID=1883156 RepID=UPI002614C211|nr:hypothetical protein [Winogradskyella sp.]
MKMKINQLLLYTFFALLTFSACQDEEVGIVETDEQEIIQPNSQLASFMANVTANYGAYDDILDGASCFSVELPVTIIAGDTTIVIETLEDIEALEELFEEFESEDDFFDFIFPITIVFSDYTEIVIENEEQLENLVEECYLDEDDDEDIIECVDFVYPISFSVFNSQFSIIDTITIESDEALYDFLDDLEDDENALIVSLNYPVTLVYPNGETVQVNSNQELANAIEAAEDDCDEDDICDIDIEVLEALLLECAFEVEIYDADDNLSDTLQFEFSSSGSIVVTGDPTVVDDGDWELQETDLGYKLIIEGLQTFTIANGLWLLDECDEDDELEFIKETDNGFITMELESDCDNGEEDEVFDCFYDFELVECLGPNNLAEFNLSANTIGLIDCPYNFSASFHVTEADAEANVNAIVETESYWSEAGEVYLRIEAESGNFEIFTVYLITDECDYFECFDNYSLVVCDEDDGIEDGFGIFDLNLIFSNCPNDDVEYNFYITLGDAENETNALISPYTNISNPQLIYSRVALAGDSSIYEIFTHELIVEDCNYNSGCTEQEVDAYLLDCIWNAVNYNGSDNLMEWNFDFEDANNIVVIYTDTQTIDALWTTSQSEDGVIVTFTNVAGPNIQEITGEWLVVECEDNRLELHRGEDILVLEKDCD